MSIQSSVAEGLLFPSPAQQQHKKERKRLTINASLWY
jgi:hypothetical protein